MSLDDTAEQDAYNAIERIAIIPRPKERLRILWSVIKYVAKAIGVKVDVK